MFERTEFLIVLTTMEGITLKKIRNIILGVWMMLGVVLLLAIAFVDRLNLSRILITNIVYVYFLCSCVVGGWLAYLKRK